MDITDISVAADAMLAMAEADASTAGTYNVSHGEPIEIRALVERLFSGLKREVRWRAMPAPVVLGGARLLELLARTSGRPPLVTAHAPGKWPVAKASMKPNCRRSRMRIGYSTPNRWSTSCCTTREWKPSTSRSIATPCSSTHW